MSVDHANGAVINISNMGYTLFAKSDCFSCMYIRKLKCLKIGCYFLNS